MSNFYPKNFPSDQINNTLNNFEPDFQNSNNPRLKTKIGVVYKNFE